MVWRPFTRQMREIVETRSIIETRIRQRMTGTAVRICAKFTLKSCLVLRSDEFEYQGQRSRSPGTKTRSALKTPPPYGRNGTPSLQITNVTLAADATIRSLQRGVFAGMRALCLAGYRWALPRISSYPCIVNDE